MENDSTKCERPSNLLEKVEARGVPCLFSKYLNLKEVPRAVAKYKLTEPPADTFSNLSTRKLRLGCLNMHPDALRQCTFCTASGQRTPKVLHLTRCRLAVQKLDPCFTLSRNGGRWRAARKVRAAMLRLGSPREPQRGFQALWLRTYL
jgi:hypothetical protein